MASCIMQRHLSTFRTNILDVAEGLRPQVIVQGFDDYVAEHLRAATSWRGRVGFFFFFGVFFGFFFFFFIWELRIRGDFDGL